MLRSRAVNCLGFVVALAMLAGCPTVDLGDVPPDPNVCRPDRAYYEEVIWPMFLAPTDPAKSCVMQSGCHAANNGTSALRLDNSAMPDHARNYMTVTRFLNCNTPGASRLLLKPLSTELDHGGGDIFQPGDPAIAAFEGWFQ